MNEKIQNLGFGQIEEIDVVYTVNGGDELDFVLEMNANGVIANRLEENGPAGGWPVYQLVPTSEEAADWLKEYMCDNMDEEDFYDLYWTE